MFSHEAYEKIVEQTVGQIHSLSKLKGGEYAGDVDRLANFRRNAASLGLSMEQVWAVYAAKHWDAVQTYVKDIATGTERVRLEGIEGRADDLIVYLILFKAILQERNAKAQRQGDLARDPQKATTKERNEWEDQKMKFAKMYTDHGFQGGKIER